MRFSFYYFSKRLVRFAPTCQLLIHGALVFGRGEQFAPHQCRVFVEGPRGAEGLTCI